jgi:hypothetical protein
MAAYCPVLTRPCSLQGGIVPPPFLTGEGQGYLRAVKDLQFRLLS